MTATTVSGALPDAVFLFLRSVVSGLHLEVPHKS